MSKPLVLLALASVLAPACSSPPWVEEGVLIVHLDEDMPAKLGAECLSLDGRPLFAPAVDPAARAERERALDAARRTFAEHPDDPEAWIWLGRRTAYLNRFQESMRLFQAGAARFPEDPRFLRHVGHRMITLRNFLDAQATLALAAQMVEGMSDEVEPAGTPNARNIDLSTRNQEIHYHLALARYLGRDFEGAAESWRECLRWARNNDSRLSATTWLYAALRRAGKHDEAREAVAWVTPGIDVVEYHGYYDLCQVYAGLMDPEQRLAKLAGSTDAINDATVGYGLANWLFIEGHEERAHELLEKVAASPTWMAFGAIAAEADLHPTVVPAIPIRIVPAEPEQPD